MKKILFRSVSWSVMLATLFLMGCDNDSGITVGGPDAGNLLGSSSTAVVDTGQSTCYNDRSAIACQNPGKAFYGQDAQYYGRQFAYQDSGNGTVRDLNTGLVWQQGHNAQRLSYYSAKGTCENLELGGYSNWRLPNIKELFSLADFRGSTGEQFFIDSGYFDLEYPDASILENDPFSSTHNVYMMGQTWSSTIYTGQHWGTNQEAAFFFNFLDGRIKQAPTSGSELFYRCVRGSGYGTNSFASNGDGTVSDLSSGLTWQQADDGVGRNWGDALAYCENLTLAGSNDWRLPNVKELQSMVDYTRSSPALNISVFTQIDPAGWFWSNTTHGDSPMMAAYVCFGACTSTTGIDTHGAGAQRSDPKSGDPASWSGLGGQSDEVRIYNYARCVRN